MIFWGIVANPFVFSVWLYAKSGMEATTRMKKWGTSPRTFRCVFGTSTGTLWLEPRLWPGRTAAGRCVAPVDRATRGRMALSSHGVTAGAGATAFSFG